MEGEVTMNDFASYRGKQPEGNETPADWEAAAREAAASFNGKSENDLLRAIYARAVEGKRNGTLTNEQIDEFYRNFSPMLDGAKRKKLRRIVEQLKSM